MPEWLENLQYLISSNIMKLGRRYATGSTHNFPSGRNKEPQESTAQATYLLPRSLQRKKFLEHGYIDGTPGDYGLVRMAVGENNYPVFQTAPDQVSRNQLVPIGNDRNSFQHTIPRQAQLQHVGDFPSAFYIDQDYKVYRKDWDLNDYGNARGAGRTYKNNQWIANLVDKLGSPTVITTGFQPVFNQVFNNKTPQKQYTLYDLYEDGNPMAINFIKNRGLIPFYEDIPLKNPFSKNREPMLDYNGNPIMTKKLTMFTLPEIIITPKRKKKK